MGKAIPVTGLGGLSGCEMLRIPHCLDNRLRDGGKVNPTHRPHLWIEKVKLSLFLTKHYAMKTYGGVDV
jgi:hypothetical protein